jgi:hypothetical protein
VTPQAKLLLQTLAEPNPFLALRMAVIRRLGSMTRESVLGELEDLRTGLAEGQRFDEEELVMTVMDQLVGWCSPQWSLAKIGRSEYDDEDPVAA